MHYGDDDPLENYELREGQMDDASEEDFEVWADAYDELNGGPESEEDR